MSRGRPPAERRALDAARDSRGGRAARVSGRGASARQLQVLLREVDADRPPAEPRGHEHRRAGAAEGVEHHAVRRAGGEDGDAAQVGRERREVQAPALRVLGQDVPHVAGLGAAGVVAEEVEAALLELASAAGHGAHVRVRRALAAADDHAEVAEAAGGHLGERLLERGERRRLLELVQRRRELDLAAVAHAAHAGGRDDGAVLHARRARRAPDGVGVVVVALGLPHEVEQQLVHVAQPVLAGVRPALDLVPHDAVAQRPALLVGEVEGRRARGCRAGACRGTCRRG